MWLTKSSSSCQNLSFFWLLDFYRISILPPLLHAENCCTIADEILFKKEAFLIQLSWNFYSIFYDKCTACIPKFQAIPNRFDHSNSDLITASSVFQKMDRFQAIELGFFKLNQTWNRLIWILSQDMNPFNPLTKCYLMNLSNSNQSKLDY